MKHVSLTVVGIMLLAVSIPDSPAPGQVRVRPRPPRPITPIAPAVAGQGPAQDLFNQGNYKEAYELFAKQALAPDADPKKVGIDLTMAINCLQNLARTDEIDAFRENVIKIHAGNWRLLQTAAQTYQNVDHGGFMVAGQFQRGQHRGGGKYVNSFERDRVRALQLMEQAIPLTKAEPAGAEVAQFYLGLAQMLMGNRGYNEAWRLGYLTDLTKLPDYEEGYNYGWGYHRGGSVRGAPVDEKGNPVYHSLPKTWQAATTDGQRWRWCLLQAVEFNAGLKTQVTLLFADFLQNQFGEQTLAYYGRRFGGGGDDAKNDTSGTWELHTLADDETIARLATGVKRFKLPDEFNFIRLYKSLEETSEDACTRLCSIYENRRQYPKAAEQWKANIARFGPGSNDHKKRQLEQIVGSWGTFESIMTQPAGAGASVEFRFRNGKKVEFTAKAVDVAKLLADVKAYLKSSPKELKWEDLQVEGLGYRLVRGNAGKYVGEQVAAWSLALEPRANHWDRRITVTTPLQKAGAYLVTAKMEGGNTTDIVLWVADTALVTKPMADKPYYYVADAVTGKPVGGANVEFFGYHQEYVGDKPESRGHFVITTKQFAENTDADGQVRPDLKDQANGFSWLVTATTPGGRMAYLGFSGVWGGQHWYDQEYNQTRTFVMTDRPVYRPKQKVNFKFWVNTAKYDVEGKSQFAGQSFNVNVTDPMGKKVHEGNFKADDYGGFDGQFELKEDAALGMYSVHIVGAPGGGGSFRVEEYKKPEFEVKVEAPTEPVALGDKFSALVKAKYYFGAPVTDAKVTYKVLRNDHSSRWFTPCPWDWLFEPGYWWYCYDYPWYPGWAKWGCSRPIMIWWGGWHRPQPPEVVAEGQARIDKDGQFKVEIDTSVAKALYGDTDHRYEITAEVVDKSRRTIVGKGEVLVARDPFKVYAWVDGGHYRVGQDIMSSFAARRLDGKGVKGEGVLKLYRITYKDNKPVEAEVESWKLATDEDGHAAQQLKAGQAGQYRLSYTVTDAAKHVIEGGYVFVVRGEGFDAAGFRFNDIELVPDKAEYKPDEKIRLMVNTNRAGASVLLFLRPANGVYKAPVVLAMTGKSTVHEIPVTKKDMPNFFVEAVTIHSGKVHTDVRQIVVPPEKRILNVQVTAPEKVKPGEKTKVRIKLTDATGEPFVGSTVVTMYDKAVEYISGGSNSPEIKAFYWNWKRTHNANTRHSLQRGEGPVLRADQVAMGFIGLFGYSLADEAEGMAEGQEGDAMARDGGWSGGPRGGPGMMVKAAAARGAVMADGPVPAPMAAPMGAKGEALAVNGSDKAPESIAPAQGGQGAPMVEATVRTQFADTAFWAAALTTGKDGFADCDVTMPENLSTWITRVWAMGPGTRVGQGTAEVITTKNLIIRLQAPRFFVQKDEVVLSGIVHNYLKTEKTARVVLDLGGKTLEVMDGKATQDVKVPAGGEKRVDWRVKVLEPGQAAVTMKALTDEESDATKQDFPVYVHGMLKTESFCGVIRPEQEQGKVDLTVPAERRPEQSRLEVRYSPTLAGAMVDALPYLATYAYGCTEQTLNRFLPTVITQKVLINMGLDLGEIQKKRTNLNAQEIGDDRERAKQWKRFDDNPVFDKAEVDRMVKVGLQRLASMQCADGGWGWFSGYGECSWPHTTAVVVHGLQIARGNDVAIVPDVIGRGVAWLKAYQARELEKLVNGRKNPQVKPWKDHADDLDALVYMVLVDEKADSKPMREFLYEDRNGLSVYAKAMLGLACHKVGDGEKRDMLIRNIEQFLVQDEENQTAWLKLPNQGYWWCWYGSEYEAHAYYLKLLAAVDGKGVKASRLVKYLLNNRKHATYWSSTRDTALCVESFADYIRASGEDKPDMTVQVLLDGKAVKEVKIDKSNLFVFDNKLVLEGPAVTTGKHVVAMVKKGTGPLYFNAYLTNFTLEDPITKAGLEIKVNRKYFQLVKVDKTVKAEGARGQAVDKKEEKYERKELKNLDTLTSGDLVEIELTIDSKNDYEYILFEDMKAAGFEPVSVQSGYGDNEMGAYMELRDERVAFFVRALARGQHSISYRMRAEIPGKFSALPTRASAMYAPELKANSDEIKLKIQDAE